MISQWAYQWKMLFNPDPTLNPEWSKSVRPLLHYANIIYDKPSSETFKGKLEAVQYNACLAITV